MLILRKAHTDAEDVVTSTCSRLPQRLDTRNDAWLVNWMCPKIFLGTEASSHGEFKLTWAIRYARDDFNNIEVPRCLGACLCTVCGTVEKQVSTVRWCPVLESLQVSPLTFSRPSGICGARHLSSWAKEKSFSGNSLRRRLTGISFLLNFIWGRGELAHHFLREPSL